MVQDVDAEIYTHLLTPLMRMRTLFMQAHSVSFCPERGMSCYFPGKST
jgi:hypothetical protein